MWFKLLHSEAKILDIDIDLDITFLDILHNAALQCKQKTKSICRDVFCSVFFLFSLFDWF